MPRLSRYFRYSASVFHLMSYLMSLCSRSMCSRTRSFTGPIDSPSPMISVVIPCRISLCERPSSISDSVDHDSMLMKPGATASPLFPLPDLTLRTTVLNQRLRGPRQHVDETRCHGEPLGVDDCLRFR